MNRRQFTKSLLGLGLGSGVVLFGQQFVAKVQAQVPQVSTSKSSKKTARSIKNMSYRNRNIVLEQGGDLDSLGESGIVRATVRGNRKTKVIDLRKRFKNNKLVFESDCFPFGESFDSPEQALQDAIDLGVIDLD